MHALRRVIGLSALLSIGTGMAADEIEPPTARDEFFEYLGSWDGDDSDWLVAARIEPTTAVGTKPAARTPRDSPERPADSGDAEMAQE